RAAARGTGAASGPARERLSPGREPGGLRPRAPAPAAADPAPALVRALRNRSGAAGGDGGAAAGHAGAAAAPPCRQRRDLALERELVADEKERAEHVMLVDLGRNDVGRVAEPGSVRVERLMDVERYSHVMHLSSLVSGRLAPGQSSLDALRAAFPAGTVSGAPKIRAMEIIADLEPDQRGCYSGALGYVGFGGNLDLAITLRTVVIADGVAYVQAGAGVVADS